MPWIDIAILVIIGVSALISLFRGFVREAFSLLTWALAVGLAWFYWPALQPYFAQWIDLPSATVALSFLAILFTVLIGGGIIGYIMAQIVDRTGLSGTDRLIGMVFGAGRGVVLVGLLVLLGSKLTPFPKDPWWQASQTIPYFQALTDWAVESLPDDLSKYFNYQTGV